MIHPPQMDVQQSKPMANRCIHFLDNHKARFLPIWEGLCDGYKMKIEIVLFHLDALEAKRNVAGE